jgi:hypothetical protein
MRCDHDTDDRDRRRAGEPRECARRQQSTPNLPGVFESFPVGVSCADGRTCLAVGNSENPTSFAERWTIQGWKPTTPIAEPTA